ncbi:MAG: isoleucine--tRNA ligase [Candidatus Thermoplasmatota archaeon]|nr:isoleucine--tRNA ligase [Candidatus Thermoplasmatota archaeon]
MEEESLSREKLRKDNPEVTRMVNQAQKKFEPKALAERITEYWKDNDSYGRMKRHREKGEDFYFIDGPPYTSGNIHMGTAWNKILKDSVIRHLRMHGYNVRDQPGYDMHGLPIEVLLERKLGIKDKRQIEIMGVGKFVNRCKDFAIKHMENMTGQFKQLGVWMDWDNPYMTIKNEYITAAWWTIKRADEQNLLTRDVRVLTWCPRCETALAEAEVEYKDVKDPSVYIKFPTKAKNEYLIIWTTTPWTLTGNLAVAVHPDYNYVRIIVNNKGVEETYIMLEDTHASVLEIAGITEYIVTETITGLGLSGISYNSPLDGEIEWPRNPEAQDWLHKVVLFEGVEADRSGIVHIAPGYGPEDFEIGKEHNLPPFCPVGPNGKMLSVTGKYNNLSTKETTTAILGDLNKKSLLLKPGAEEHRYGHCWRCKNPVIYRITSQWFIKISEIREQMLAEVDRVEWTPEWVGTGRQRNWVENSRDWCISRQRYWGIPIPVWECECGHQFVAGKLDDMKGEIGYREDLEMHRPWVDAIKVKCTECGKLMDRVPDVMDVWLDSAVSSWGQLGYPLRTEEFERWWPCRWIAEGHDQTRGWFYSQLGASVVAHGKAPYNSVLTHGFTLDKEGKPMSKSQGNVVDPIEVIGKYGADSLRMYILGASAPWEDLTYAEEGVASSNKTMNILWNSYYLATTYMALDNFNPRKDTIARLKNDLEIQDRWILSRLETMKQEMEDQWRAYNLHKVVRALEDFLTNDFSRWYVRLSKDRAWIENPRDTNKMCFYATMCHVLSEVSKLIAPLAPYISEEIYQNLDGRLATVHMEDWPMENKSLQDLDLEKKMATVEKIVEAASNARQKAGIKLRWPLRRIIIKGNEEVLEAASDRLGDIILSQTNVKSIELIPDDKEWDEMTVEVEPNLDAIGPVFRQWASRIAILLRQQDPHHIMEKMKVGEYVLGIEGQRVNITEEMLRFKTKLPDHIFESEFEGGVIYLDSQMNDSLLSEAYCREVIRRIQQMRKDMDLNVEDSIEAKIFVEEDMGDLLYAWGEHIAEQTRAELLEFLSGPPTEGYVVEWSIDERPVTIGLLGIVYEKPETPPHEAHATPLQMAAVAEKIVEIKEHIKEEAPAAETATATEKADAAKPDDIGKKEPTAETKQVKKEKAATGKKAVPAEEKADAVQETKDTKEEKSAAETAPASSISPLDVLVQVKGVGKKKAEAIINAGFDTLEKLCNADVSELTKVKGVNKQMARKIIASSKDCNASDSVKEKLVCPVCGAGVGDNDKKCPRCNTVLLEPDKKPSGGKPSPTSPEAGNTYLVPAEKDGRERAFAIFNSQMEAGFNGLCITKDYPDKMRKKHGLKDARIIWLSETEKDDAVPPKNLEKINFLVEGFLKEGKSVVMLDGIEYLTTNNKFQSVLRLVGTIKDQASVHGGIVIIPVEPAALGQKEFIKMKEDVDGVL